MRKTTMVMTAAALVLGLTTLAQTSDPKGTAVQTPAPAAEAAKEKPAPPPPPPLMTLYKDKDAKVAAKAMLDEALKRAGKDNAWDRLGVARVLYLSGDKAAAQPIMDAVQAKDKDPENLMRLGRIYVEAGEWTKAAPIFDKILAISPDDDDFTLEIAVLRLQNGDRAGAESILDKLFAGPNADPDYLIKAAGGFLGVKP